jgi:hypothetical protein
LRRIGRGTHGLEAGAVAFKAAVLQIDACETIRLGGEAHFGLTCQAITKRFGGSQTRMLPQSHSVPSACSV